MVLYCTVKSMPLRFSPYIVREHLWKPMTSHNTNGKRLFSYSVKKWFPTFIHILQSCIYDVLIAVVSGTLQLLQWNLGYSNVYGREPRFNEIHVITNTMSIHKRKRKIYLDITNKCPQHVIKSECQTDQQSLCVG